MTKSTRDLMEWILQDLETLNGELGYPSKIGAAIQMVEGNNPRSKGDYIEAITDMNPSIRVIDTAIPQHLCKELQGLGLDCSAYAYAYYHNGTSGIINPMAEWAVLINNS